MPKESKTTIQKLSSRQVRFLATPDSDPELTKVVANPVNTSRDQKKNYAVDGLVKALKDLNPALNKIHQKNRIVTDKRSGEAGTKAALLGEDADPDELENRAYMQKHEQVSAAVDSDVAILELSKAYETKGDMPDADFFAGQKTQQEADVEGRSTAYGIAFLEKTRAATLQLKMGAQAKAIERVQQDSMTNQAALLSTRLDKYGENFNVKEYTEWRTLAKSNSYLNSDQVNEMAMDAAERQAAAGDDTLLEVLKQNTAQGGAGLAFNPNYTTRFTAAETKAAKVRKALDDRTQAKDNYKYEQEVLPMVNKAYSVLEETGNVTKAIAQLDFSKFKVKSMYFAKKKELNAAHNVSQYDPAAFGETLDLVQAGARYTYGQIEGIHGLKDSEKVILRRMMDDPKQLDAKAKMLADPVFKESWSSAQKDVKLELEITRALSNSTKEDFMTQDQGRFANYNANRTLEGMRNEMLHQDDTGEFPAIKKKWIDRYRIEATQFNVQSIQHNRAGFIYRTRASLEEAWGKKWISNSQYEIHKRWLGSDEAVEQRKKDHEAFLTRIPTTRETVDKSNATIRSNSVTF